MSHFHRVRNEVEGWVRRGDKRSLFTEFHYRVLELVMMKIYEEGYGRAMIDTDEGLDQTGHLRWDD